MKQKGLAMLSAAVALCLLSGFVHAQLPRTHIKGIGETTAIIHGSLLEQPFWKETIPQASGGTVTGDMLPFDQVGIDNAAVLRLLKLGGMDFGTTDLSRLAADDPRFEGCDLAGLSLTIDKARAACNAYRPVLDKLLQENWNAKLLYRRHRPAAGVLVPRAGRRARRPEGQEGARLQQDHDRLPQRRRRHRRQHGVSGGRAVASARRDRLRRDRNAQRQHRRLGRGHHAPVPDVARLGSALHGGQPRLVEALRSEGARFLRRAIQEVRGQSLGHHGQTRPPTPTTAIPASSRARWASRRS